jgi:hypothetical protein
MATALDFEKEGFTKWPAAQRHTWSPLKGLGTRFYRFAWQIDLKPGRVP